jgi:uncharacterized protein (DUF4415 family)
MKIVRDEPKRVANLAKHGRDFSDLALDFLEGALVIGARQPLWKAIGMSGKRADRIEDRGYTQADLDEVSDNPEITREEMSRAQSFAEVFPDLAESIRRVRGKQKAPTKQLISIRLDRDVIETFRATGDGWQARMNAALRAQAAKMKKRAG